MEASVRRTSDDLEKAMARHAAGYQGAIYLLGTEIVTRAMRRTPVDSGYLRASRYVQKPSFTATSFVFEVGFSAPYAFFVHERDLKYRVGEWKFLTKAVDDVAAGAERFIAVNTERLAKAGQGIDDIPEIHPTGPLVGPQIHPRLRARRRRLEAQAEKDRRKGLSRAPTPRRSQT